MKNFLLKTIKCIKEFIKDYFWNIVYCILFSLIVTGIALVTYDSLNDNYNDDYIEKIVENKQTPIQDKIEYREYGTCEMYIEKNTLKYDSIKLVLVNEVNTYINSVTNSSALDGIVIVNSCIKYNIDICFVLAQAEIESHFGTKGLARKTNSVFNVFAFDGQTYNEINKNGKYAHPNNSVEPYLNLLCKEYLIDGKTEYDLLHNYINKDGKRYASDENYEKNLFDKMDKIRKSTKIDNTSLLLKKHALIIGLN